MNYQSIILRLRKEPPHCGQEHKKTAATNWLDLLPNDLIWMIISKLCAFDILTSAQHVCRQWRSLCMDPCMWRTIHMCNIGIYNPEDSIRLKEMCRHAIDRSCGQLVDISIWFIGSDRLLKYIIDSGCDQLRRLRLIECGYLISDEGLCAMAEKLPLLEELDITNAADVSSIALEAIGQGCPLLKSLKWNHHNRDYIGEKRCNENAFAIAQNMPNLRHLQLVGSKLTNIGVSAILDGCRCLESLDLRLCGNVDLNGELRRRCYEQLKYFVKPDTRYCFRGHESGYLCNETACYDFTFEYRSGKKKLCHFTCKETQSDSELSDNSCVEFEEEWEETYATWECKKNQRSRKGFQKYFREKEKRRNTKEKERRH